MPAHWIEDVSLLRDGMLIDLQLLGTSLSGKTTIYRQIQALVGNNFSSDSQEVIRSTILQNLRAASLLVYFKIDRYDIEINAAESRVRNTKSAYHFLIFDLIA